MLNEKVENRPLIRGEVKSDGIEMGMIEVPIGSQEDETLEQDEGGLTGAFMEQMIGAFRRLADFIPTLRVARPQEYEAILADIFTESLQYDDAARIGYIRVLLNAIDGNLLQDYLDSFIDNQVDDLKKKSQFRVAVENLQNDWFRRWRLKLNVPIIKVDSNESIERRAQLSILKKSFDSVLYKRDANGAVVYLYPDEKLIEEVEKILDTGKFYHWLPSSWSLDGFLVQLKELNELRRAGKLEASSATLFSSKNDLIHIVKVLAISHDKLAKRLQDALPNLEERDYLNQKNAMDAVTKLMSEINSLKKNEDTLKGKITCLEEKINQLKVLQQKWKHESTLLYNIQKENSNLKRSLDRREREIHNLKKGILPTDCVRDEGELRKLRRRTGFFGTMVEEYLGIAPSSKLYYNQNTPN